MAVNEDVEVQTGLDQAVDAEVDADLLELLRLMPPVFRALKRQGPSGGESGPPAALRKLLEAGTLAPRHLPVIVVLSLQGSMTVSELARRIGLGVAATSLMVGDLAKAGVVERQIDEQDRRRTLVSIGAELQADCVSLAQGRLAPVRRALQRMGPQTRRHFIAGWRALAAETVGLQDLAGEEAERGAEG